MIKKLLVSAALFIPVSSMAAPIDDLDVRFRLEEERGSIPTLSALRSDYEALLSSTTDVSERTHIIVQVARLDTINGEVLLTPAQKAERKAAFKNCEAGIERLADKNTAEYHYFKVGCVALRLQSSTRIEQATSLPAVRTLVKSATDYINGANDINFEGGGVARALALLHVSPETSPAPELHNVAEAKVLIQKALGTAGKQDRIYSVVLSGDDYIDNHFVNAKVLEEAGEIDSANQVADSAICYFGFDIEDSVLRIQNRILETNHAINRLKGELNRAPDCSVF